LKDETKGGLRSLKRGLVGAFKDIAKTAAGFLTRDLVKGLVSVSKESISLGAKTETLRNSFKALKGDVSDSVLSLDTLRDSVGGAVSDIDLMEAANNALALGLPTEDLNELFEAAQKVGAAMGRTTLEAVNDLTTGLGRQSKLILDNLGIMVDTNQAYEDYAETLGKTVEELDETEKKMAFQAAAMASLAEKAELLDGAMSDTQLSQEAFKASVENLKAELGERLIPIMVDVTESFTGIASVALDVVEDLMAGDWEGVYTTIEGVFGQLVDGAAEWFGAVYDTAVEILDEVDWEAAFDSLSTWMEGIIDWIVDTAGDIGTGLTDWVGSVDWPDVFDTLKTYVQGITDKIVEWAGDVGAAFTEWVGEIDWEGVFDSLKNFMGSFFTTIVGWAGDIATAFVNWFTDIEWLDVFKSLNEWMLDFWAWLFAAPEDDPTKAFTGWISDIDWLDVFGSLLEFAAGLVALIVNQMVMAPVSLGLAIAQWIDSFDWADIFSAIGTGIQDAITGAIDDIWDLLPEWFTDFWDWLTGGGGEGGGGEEPEWPEGYEGEGYGQGQNLDFAGPFAKGGTFSVNRPTLFAAGEAGRELVTVVPLPAAAGGADVGGTSQLVVENLISAETIVLDPENMDEITDQILEAITDLMNVKNIRTRSL